MSDPYSVGTGRRRAFWADAAADAVEERVGAADSTGTDADGTVVIKGGVSPSGVPHLGHFNEILRGYFVAEALRERGHAVRQVFTTDDRDRLRGLPRTLADLEWELVGLEDVDAGALGRNLGRPYTDVPDPFGCCDSYGAHFTTLLERGADAVDVPIEVVSNTELYRSGALDEAVRLVLANRDRARELLAEFQDGVSPDYVPFFPICGSCGHLVATVSAVDLEAETVEYVCTDVETDDGVIEGCGHRGTASFREGKLPWRFEWPAQWHALDVDFEPFGKDHAEGSWPSGERIARELFGIEPPVPMAYEWFTLDGEALSSSAGNVITVAAVLELVEAPVLRYFFTKNPAKQRDFAVEAVDRLVEEFDRFERVYFGVADGAVEPVERDRAERAYPMVVEEVPEAPPVRVPFRFAAVLGMTDDRGLRLAMARRSGHLPADADSETIDAAMARVEKARRWAERTDNEFNYRLAEELPDVPVDAETAAALEELADYIERESPDADALQGEFYETAKRHDVPVAAFFETGYRLFLEETTGPRLGPFLAPMDETFVVERLRRNA